MKRTILLFLVLVSCITVKAQENPLPGLCPGDNFVIRQGDTTYVEINTTSHQTIIENSLLCLEPEPTRPACNEINRGCLEYYDGPERYDLQICTLRGDIDVDSEYNSTYEWQSLLPEIQIESDSYLLKTDESTVNSGTPVALTDATFTPRDNAFKIVDSAAAGDNVDFPVVVIGIDGNPIVAYRYYDSSSTSFNIKMLFCKDPHCEDPSATPITLQNSGNLHIGAYLSMVIDPTGVPVLVARNYISSGNGNIVFIRCSDRFCSSNTLSTPASVAGVSSADVGDLAAVAIGQNGFPVLAYRDYLTSQGFFVQQCTNADCTTSLTASRITTAGTTLSQLSMEISPQTQFPVITTISGNNGGTMHVTYCTTISCSSSNQLTINTGNVPGFSANSNHLDYVDTTILDNGNLLIYAYQDFSTYRYSAFFTCSGPTVDCDIQTGSSGDVSGSVTHEYGVGVTVDGRGYPAQIAYATVTGGTYLFYSRCFDPVCSSLNILGVHLDTITLPSTVQKRQCSMTTGANGYPVLAYINAPGGVAQVRFIALANQFGTPYFKR